MIPRVVLKVIVRKKLKCYQADGMMSKRYGTWALSRLTSANSGRVQPVLDIEFVLKHKHLYEESIQHRRLQPAPPILKLPLLYAEAVKLRDLRDEAQRKREDNSAEVSNIDT